MNHASRPAQSPPDPSGRRVLLVEVDPQAAELEKTILEQADFVVQLAAGGYEALKLIRAEPPDAVVIEARLPGLSGFEVCEKIKADPQTQHIPVLVCSATPADGDEACRRGANGFLAKPGEIMELPGRLKWLLRI